METQKLLEMYQAYIKKNDIASAKKMLKDHAADKRFLSLVDLREAFVTGFTSELEKQISDHKKASKKQELVAASA